MPEINDTTAERPNDPVEVTRLQSESKAKYRELMDSPEARQGSFKRIVPVNDQVAVAMIESKQGEKDKAALEHEVKLLEILRENNLPALQTHGGVFEVKPGTYGVLMDWHPTARLLDGKDPDAVNLLVMGLLLDIKIPTGEGWVMHLERIKKEVQHKLQDPNTDIEQVKAAAQNLKNNFSKLMDTLKQNNIVIGDLQLLVNSKGDITIIDPIDVLKKTPDKTRANQFNWVDIVDPTKPTSPDFMESTRRSQKMLEAGRDICDKISRTIDSNPQLLGTLVISSPQAKNFTPGFKAGGGGGLRQQLLKGKTMGGFEDAPSKPPVRKAPR